MRRITLTLIIIALACAWAMPTGAIVTRHDMDNSAYLAGPEEVSGVAFFYLGGRFGQGTGTLISDRWVLTAGHVAKFLKTGSRVTIDEEDYQVAEIIPHPSYVLNQAQHDIGLIALDRPVTSAKPYPLYENTNEQDQWVLFIGAGAGGTGKTGVDGSPGILRKAMNQVVSVSEQWLEFTFDAPPNGHALEGISGPGDSGGPAFIDADGTRYVAGVSAWQRNSGQEGVYGVQEFYARVSSYVGWIHETIEAADERSRQSEEQGLTGPSSRSQ